MTWPNLVSREKQSKLEKGHRVRLNSLILLLVPRKTSIKFCTETTAPRWRAYPGDFHITETIFFGVFSRFMRLVPVIISLQGFYLEDISVRVSCYNGFEVYFRIYYFDGFSTSYTFQVPEGAECEVLIVDIGNSQCCENGEGIYMILYGNETKDGNSDLLAGGGFVCRARGKFIAAPNVRE